MESDEHEHAGDQKHITISSHWFHVWYKGHEPKVGELGEEKIILTTMCPSLSAGTSKGSDGFSD